MKKTILILFSVILIILLSGGAFSGLSTGSGGGSAGGPLVSQCTVVSEQGNQKNGVQVDCPEGYVVTGGGWRDSINGFGRERDQDASYPLDGDTWYCLDDKGGKDNAVCYAVCCDGDLIETEILSENLPSGNWEVEVGCGDETILGGGFLDAAVDDNDDQDKSYPGDNEWVCRDHSSSTDSECYAVCGSAVEGYELGCISVFEEENQESGVFVECPDGYVVTGGGFLDASGKGDDQDTNGPEDNGWYCAEDNSDPDSKCYARCCSIV